MLVETDSCNSPFVLDANGLGRLIASLHASGHRVLGPTRRDNAVVYDEVRSTSDLPRGWVDEQAGGHYRLKREGEAYFGYTIGPTAWKSFLHPPKQSLWSTKTGNGQTEIRPASISDEKLAFLGVRACELAAIAVQDKVFLDGAYRDPHYAARRANLFIIAVNCGRAASTCFCSSMGTGPKAREGYDLALTEFITSEDVAFLAVAGSKEGAEMLSTLPTRPATQADIDASTEATAQAESQINRRIDTSGLSPLLKENPDHPRWNDVASRCLNCANCTMVCPTCFCTKVEEVSDLDGVETSRVQSWASCFTSDFSYIHGGAVRTTPKARYRQWMTHKLATWVDQFGTSGCVGCGRCITWCPVGIDITEEAAAIRSGNKGG
ncbi:MAG: sulfite reductase subunit A [Rhodobacteraceae bacterium]|nr:sulfite reductase subunit A [Paracoccaceae bacterium]